MENDTRGQGSVPPKTGRDLYAIAGHKRRWITAREVAEMLSTTPRTVYRMVQSGELPGIRFGNSVRIPLAALERWIEEKEEETEWRSFNGSKKAR